VGGHSAAHHTPVQPNDSDTVEERTS
jgi:hypothetical protein